MSQFRTMALGLAALLTVVLVACADTTLPLSPKTEALIERDGVAGGLDAPQAAALERRGGGGKTTDHARITPEEGGTLSAGGVTLTIPPGAVQQSVEVKLTVPDGNKLFAKFQPHGLEFDAPATISFDLGDVGPLVEVRGFYVGEGYGLGEWFDVLEEFDAVVADGAASFQIEHFSGYIVASGYESRSRH